MYTTRLLLAALAITAPAQTYIVDVNNGPGTHYRDLPSAISAVPDGAVLHVRAGAYAAFSVADKALTILGAGAATTVASPGFAIVSTTPGKTVVIQDLAFAGTVSVAGCQGPVQLTRISGVTTGILPTRLTVGQSANVHLHAISLPESAGIVLSGQTRVDVDASRVELTGCSLVGLRQPTAGAEGMPALSATGSRLALFSTSILGGGGGSDGFTTFGAGGPGLSATDCVLDLGPGNRIVGGTGGVDPDILGCYTVVRAGGPGLQLVRSRATTRLSTIRGGDGPCRVCISAPCTTFGLATRLDQFSSLRSIDSAPLLSTSGTLAIGGHIDFRVAGNAQELALLMLGFSPTVLDLDSIIDFAGILCMPDLPFAVLTLDNNGAATYRLPLTTSFQVDRMVWAQYFTFVGATLPGKGSNSTSFVVRS